MKVIKKEGAPDYDAIDFIEYFGSCYIQKIAKKIKSSNDLTNDVINILVKDCCENSKYKIHYLAEQLRLYDKLTDDNIKIMIKNCLPWYIPNLAIQIRLANKLTDKYIELLIDCCYRNDIPENY